jgi:hypothetical protein
LTVPRLRASNLSSQAQKLLVHDFCHLQHGQTQKARKARMVRNRAEESNMVPATRQYARTMYSPTAEPVTLHLRRLLLLRCLCLQNVRKLRSLCRALTRCCRAWARALGSKEDANALHSPCLLVLRLQAWKRPHQPPQKTSRL